MDGLVGRDDELAATGRFIEAAGDGPWAVVLDGEAGIGKTALWRALVDEVRQKSDAFVMATRSTEAETAMPFTGLSDLVRTVPSTAFVGLPEPQRVALEVATLRTSARAEPVDERAIATALATLLSRLADHQRVVVALDDVQWLDDASRGALEFAARRLTGLRVGILATIRSPHPRVPVIGAVDSTAVPVHTEVVGPLRVAAVHQLVRDELGYPLPRPTLMRVAEASAGNPFFALELARAIRRTGDRINPGAPLPVPDTLRELTIERLAALSDDSRRSLLFAATAAHPTVALLERLGADGGLAEAETAGVVDIHSGRIEFRHPLLASAALILASPSERRAAHTSVAAATGDPEQRARHLALAADGPSEEVANALEIAVTASRARGAVAAAADLARLALDHTIDPNSDAAMRRTALLGDLLFAAGDAIGAEAQYRRVVEGGARRNVRSRAALRLTEIVYETGRADPLELAEMALDDAADHPELSARALLILSILRGPPDAADLTKQAREQLEAMPSPDPMLLGWAIFQEASNRFSAGDGLDVEAINHGLELERTGRTWHSSDQVANSHPTLLKFADHFDAARRGLEELRQRALDEGNDGQLPYIVGHLPVLLLRQGDWEGAAAAATEHMELAEAAGQAAQVAQAHYNVAFVALHHGQFAEAYESAHALLRFADGIDDSYLIRAAHMLLGALRLQQDEPGRAVDHLERCWRITTELADDPGVARFQGDLVEALVARGDLPRAKEVIATTEAAAARSGRVSVSAIMARSRAQVAASEGDINAALAAIDEALTYHNAVPIPFDQARTMLLKGQLHRRAKAKRMARDALTDALETFERLGAAYRADKTRVELSRVNIRPPAPLELTATERRIAELAAQGMTNKQIAEAAFVSPKTVEANLARVYRKLGIASRAELGSRMAST